MSSLSTVRLKQVIVAFLVILGGLGTMKAQVGVNTDGADPDPSAVLDISSTEGGFLLPRMDRTQRLAISSPANGLLVYQTPGSSGDEEGFYMYSDGAWKNISALQSLRAEVIMGSPPIVLPGSTLSVPANLSYDDVGVMNVSLSPAMANADYTVILTPEHKPNPTPPVPPEDYCIASHSGVCTNTYENRTIIVTHPAGAYSAKMGPPFVPGAPAYETLFWHRPGGGTTTPCQNPDNTDYYFHSVAGTNRDGFSSNSFNNPYTYFFSGIFNSISAIPAGNTFDLMLSGNEDNTVPYTSMNSTVFIDWNSDGDFFDTVDGLPELVLSTGLVTWPPVSTHTYAGNNMWALQVPTNAVTGATTMRVMATRFANNSSPCINDSEGSTRDYVFTISGGAAANRPGDNRFCNIANQTASGFKVRCYDDRGAPVDDRVFMIIDPK